MLKKTTKKRGLPKNPSQNPAAGLVLILWVIHSQALQLKRFPVNHLCRNRKFDEATKVSSVPSKSSVTNLEIGEQRPSDCSNDSAKPSLRAKGSGHGVVPDCGSGDGGLGPSQGGPVGACGIGDV